MLITILIHLPLPPPPSAPSWSQYMSTMYNLIKWQIFLSCIFFLEFLEVACNSDLSFEGVCGIKPYKVTLDLQSNSPFVEGSKKQFVRRILLSVRCYFAALFHATLHYFVHATCQEDNNVFGSTLKRLLLYWGKVSVVNPDCFGFACMYEFYKWIDSNSVTVNVCHVELLTKMCCRDTLIWCGASLVMCFGFAVCYHDLWLLWE